MGQVQDWPKRPQKGLHFNLRMTAVIKGGGGEAISRMEEKQEKKKVMQIINRDRTHVDNVGSMGLSSTELRRDYGSHVKERLGCILGVCPCG